MRSANLVSVLEELKTILSSPIKPLPVTSDINETENKTEMDDIPNQFTKVLGKGNRSNSEKVPVDFMNHL